MGQASRISGVNPSGIQAIMVYLRGKGRRSDGSDEKLAKTGAKALEILWRVNEWFPELSLEQRALFKKYHEELLRFNSSLNLIGVGTIANSDLVHFSDSIMACRNVVVRRRLGVCMILARKWFSRSDFTILSPKTHVLVESDLRKAEFLKHICATLNLKTQKFSLDELRRCQMNPWILRYLGVLQICQSLCW